MTNPIPHRNARTGGSGKPRTSRVAPIRTVTRKGWHRPSDRWQCMYAHGAKSYRLKPIWTDGPDEYVGSSPNWNFLGKDIFTAAERKRSLFRIITKPRRTAKGTR